MKNFYVICMYTQNTIAQTKIIYSKKPRCIFIITLPLNGIKTNRQYIV
ncbi:hypothetical protein P243_1462 [Klebsiella pneumoniae subsp. pneumoniae 1158]|nr:hypothetical protein P243_1462 [Klebsiella pneumoniae subsp. pneumoniae 1158]KDX66668.1 hypothetical protein AB02_3034 [Escherichia coli 2-222-05_S1_C1]KDX74356.1 hypothetical protein AB31_3075 [Escherichia coli 2-222-05_S1_C2]